MTSWNGAGTIAVAAGHCMRLFEKILSNSPIDPQCEQQCDRFRLWAGNIGARQVGKSSLDHRLREASEMADLVSELLQGLQTQLDQWISTKDNPVLSDRIRETIDDLYALLLIIRQPPPLDRYTKSEDVDLSYFQEFDARHVREKYPLLHSKEWLVARLAHANVRRRQFLKYRELHDQRLSQVSEALASTNIDTAETTGIVLQPQKGREAATTAIAPHSEAGRSSKAPTLADTVATPFIPKVDTGLVDDFDDAQSATTFASYVGGPGSTRLHFPPRPKGSLGGHIFVCPLCYFPEQVGNDEGWKRHVLHDLQPYVCTFEHCPSTLFSSRHAWFDHELAAHRKEWICTICNIHTKSAVAFVEHAQSVHQRTFPEKLVSKILQQNERAQTRYKANDCPFCDDWKVKHDDSNVPEEDIYVTVKQFSQHVGRHMEELALFVLPVDLDDDFQSQRAVGEADSFASSQSMFEVTDFTKPNESVDGFTERLLVACNQEDLGEVRNLVRSGIDVNLEFEDGSTPLMKAVERESVEFADLLLHAGANVNHVNKYGDTAFAWSIRHSQVNMIMQFLKFRPDVNFKGPQGETLLMIAARHDDSSQMLKLLVEAGADVSAKDRNGRTALLHYFSTSIDLRTEWEVALDVLSEASVDIEATDDAHGGFRVVHWIAFYGLSKACRRLLQLGADIDAQDRNGRTPLRIAMMHEQKEVALLLLDLGADVGQTYPIDLHSEMRPLLGWASSNDRLHVGKLVVHKRRSLKEDVGEGILRRVSKVIRVDSPYIFEVEDLATEGAGTATQKARIYRGYSTDFIPLRPEAGHSQDLVGPGHHVLACYPGTRIFLPGLCHSLNFQSVTVQFLIDEEGSSRGVDARFVIPWKVRSSRDSTKREPPLSFYFIVRSIKPDYVTQARHVSSPPDSLWVPPTDPRAFKQVASTGLYQWHNGHVRPIPSTERQYWIRYSQSSIFWCTDRQAFLHVPCDCTEAGVSVSGITGGKDYHKSPPWAKITFHHKPGPDNWVLHWLGYDYEDGQLSALDSPRWMPELLPIVYQCDGHEGYSQTAELAGDLSLIVGLAVFSAAPDKVLATMQDSFRAVGPQWKPHGRVGVGRVHERGLVVEIGYDSRMGWDEHYLKSWEDGKFGPIIV